MKYQAVSAKADTFGRWIAIALGFSIPLSTAADNILIGALVLCWVLSAGFLDKWQTVRDNPVAWLALGLFLLLCIGLLYGERYPGDGLHYLGKYKELPLIALLLPLLRHPQMRRFAVLALATSLVLTLLVSYAIAMGLLPQYAFITVKDLYPRSFYPVSFKLSLTHNILMAFGAFLFALLARHATDYRMRLTWAALALLAVGNVLFMVQGRTGYLILGALLLYFFASAWRWKGVVIALVLGLVLSAAAYYGSATFRTRIQTAAQEYSAWQPGKRSETSVGERLDWYMNSLRIIREHPFLGVGTGGFTKAYTELVPNSKPEEARNPHNEYLLITAQLGLTGLALLLGLFLLQWRQAPRLPTLLETQLARGLVITMMTGCLFNSLLLDHTESLLYAWMSALLYSGLNPNLENTRAAT